MFRVFEIAGKVFAVLSNVRSLGRTPNFYVYGDDCAKPLLEIGSFSANSAAEFSQLMKAMIEKHSEKWLDKPDSDGLWWHAYYDEHDHWFCDIVSISLQDEDGYQISVIGTDEPYSFDECGFNEGKWQKVTGPIPFK